MHRPLRIVHVTIFYPPYSFGGDAIYVQRLARAQVAAGCKVDVVHCINSFRIFNNAEPRKIASESPNLTIHSLQTSLGVVSPLLSHQTGRPYLTRTRIQNILDLSRPDVIHYHNISLFGPGVLALRPHNSKAIKLYTTHDHWLVCPTSVLWKFNERPCEKPECLQCTVRARRPPQLWRYTDMLDRYAAEVDVFLSASRFAAEMHARRGFGRPMIEFPLFVGTPDSPNGGSYRKRTRPFFLFVGRLESIKGVHSLIDIWERIPDIDLLIAGSGSQETVLRRRAASLSRIVFLGHLSEAELGSLYRDCLACIVPSLTYETSSLVILEAFSYRAPVIARDLGALSELITESGGGLLYKSQSELLASLNRIVESPELRENLAEKGYRAFTNRWTTEAHLERYTALVRDTALRKFGRVPWESE